MNPKLGGAEAVREGEKYRGKMLGFLVSEEQAATLAWASRRAVAHIPGARISRGALAINTAMTVALGWARQDLIRVLRLRPHSPADLRERTRLRHYAWRTEVRQDFLTLLARRLDEAPRQ